MHDNPEPTESEREQTPERIPEEDAMSGQGHEDPHGQGGGHEAQEVQQEGKRAHGQLIWRKRNCPGLST